MLDEQIGKHKGAVETLMHEKKELSRLLQIVNGQLKRHLSALQEQGIDPEEFMEEVQQQSQERQQQQGGQGQSGQQDRQGRSRGRDQSRSSDDDEEFDLSGHLE